jgi:hypothetical protein
MQCRSDAVPTEGCGEFRSLARAIFRDIEVSAGTDALWDMSSRTVVEAAVVHRPRRRRCRRCRRCKNKIARLRSLQAGYEDALQEQAMTVSRILQLESPRPFLSKKKHSERIHSRWSSDCLLTETYLTSTAFTPLVFQKHSIQNLLVLRLRALWLHLFR